LGIRALPEALSIARAAELDLVEVAATANPPVCRIMNYSKYKFEEQQRAKESRRKSSNIVVKEMKYRPKIGDGDFNTKTRKVEHFLAEGHKVKVTIMFRGREMQHPELGRKILDRIAVEVVDIGKVEIMPRQDGRNMTMVLGPDKAAQKAAVKRTEEALAEAAEAAEAAELDLALDADSTDGAVTSTPDSSIADNATTIAEEPLTSAAKAVTEVADEADADTTTAEPVADEELLAADEPEPAPAD